MILGGLFDTITATATATATPTAMTATATVTTPTQRATHWAGRVLPQRCFFCADSGCDAVCKPCSDSLPRTAGDACPRCQLQSVASQVCGRCVKRPPRWNRLIAPWRYEFPMDRAMVAGKRAAAFSVYEWFADSLVGALSNSNVWTTVIPVPSSAQRLQMRGYNHASLIAQVLARRLAINGDHASLVRIRDTDTQYHRNWVERRINVRGAFAATRSLAAQRVLLVDDVLTTGATLNELSAVAFAAGALSVDALVLARAQPMRRRERIAKFGRSVA
jgi:ComF family protein